MEVRKDGCGILFDGGSEGQGKIVINILESKYGIIAESDITKEDKVYVNIKVSKKGFIRCNAVGDNLRSNDFVLKYGLKMLIEGGDPYQE